MYRTPNGNIFRWWQNTFWMEKPVPCIDKMRFWPFLTSCVFYNQSLYFLFLEPGFIFVIPVHISTFFVRSETPECEHFVQLHAPYHDEPTSKLHSWLCFCSGTRSLLQVSHAFPSAVESSMSVNNSSFVEDPLDHSSLLCLVKSVILTWFNFFAHVDWIGYHYVRPPCQLHSEGWIYRALATVPFHDLLLDLISVWVWNEKGNKYLWKTPGQSCLKMPHFHNV